MQTNESPLSQAIHSAVFQTKWGWMALAASERGLCAIVLPQRARLTVEVSLRKRIPVSSNSASGAAAGRLIELAQTQLCEYFAGTRRTLDLPVDLRGGSSFQRRVWRATQHIPYGRVRSYQWLAFRVGGRGYARAVGHALGANPVPIVVPCHRVVAHDASLGGFTGGLRTKRRLLGLEGTLPFLGAAVGC